MLSQKGHVLKLQEWYDQVFVYNFKCQRTTYWDDFLYVYQLLKNFVVILFNYMAAVDIA